MPDQTLQIRRSMPSYCTRCSDRRKVGVRAFFGLQGRPCPQCLPVRAGPSDMFELRAARLAHYQDGVAAPPPSMAVLRARRGIPARSSRLAALAHEQAARRYEPRCLDPIMDSQCRFEIDQRTLVSLLEFGVSENAGRRACAAVGDAGFEAAFEWYVDHIDDHDIQEPFPKGLTDETCLQVPSIIYASSPECVVCLNAKADCYVAPCGHCCGCYGCLEAIRTQAPTPYCPLCRQVFHRITRVDQSRLQ